MPLQVKVGEKKAKPRAKLGDADFRFPREKSTYWQALLAVAMCCLIPAGVTLVIVLRTTPPGGMPLWQIPSFFVLWPILCLIVVPVLAGRPMRKRIKESGRQAKVMATNYPEIHQLVRSQCSTLGLKEPDVYVLDDEVGQVVTMAGAKPALVITRPILNALTGDELGAAIAHQLGHIKAGHVRMENVLTFMRDAAPSWQVIFGPATLFRIFLGTWAQMIECTADRVGLLLTNKIASVNAAAVKLAVEADSLAQVDPRELRAYLSSSGELSTDSSQMERHYRIGTFISQQPGLRERIAQLIEYSGSEEAQEAFSKLHPEQGQGA
ncbi:MAG: M48 family metalloprotease [Armatimonadota bacterium]